MKKHSCHIVAIGRAVGAISLAPLALSLSGARLPIASRCRGRKAALAKPPFSSTPVQICTCVLGSLFGPTRSAHIDPSWFHQGPKDPAEQSLRL